MNMALVADMALDLKHSLPPNDSFFRLPHCMLFTLVLCCRGGDSIYEMRCLFVAVGLNARFIVLPHCTTIRTLICFLASYFWSTYIH